MEKHQLRNSNAWSLSQLKNKIKTENIVSRIRSKVPGKYIPPTLGITEGIGYIYN